MAIPSQAIKPVIPEVFSSHRYTVWLPNMEVRKHKPAITCLLYTSYSLLHTGYNVKTVQS